jgi:hypothetical protein
MLAKNMFSKLGVDQLLNNHDIMSIYALALLDNLQGVISLLIYATIKNHYDLIRQLLDILNSREWMLEPLSRSL